MAAAAWAEETCDEVRTFTGIIEPTKFLAGCWAEETTEVARDPLFDCT